MKTLASLKGSGSLTKTMKFIHPIAYQLSLAEDRVKILEKENHELRLELAQITGRNSRHTMARLFSSPSRNRSTTPEHTLPSYARSTTTSRLRSLASSASSSRSTSPGTDWSPSPPTPPKYLSINGKSCAYKDGELYVTRFDYLKSTVASRHRDEISLSRIRHRPILPDAQKTSEASTWSYSTDQSCDADCSEEPEELEEPQPAHSLRIMSQTEWDDLITQKAIAIRTRLADKAWIRGSAYTVYIDHDILFDILSSTETLAKRCLWGWMRTHQPDQCRRWIGYRSDIDFGRERLTTLLDRLPSNIFKFRHTRHWQVTSKLNRLIDLRNFLHHFHGRRNNVCHMDDYVEIVQKLAVLLYDEEAASRARALRDMLRGEAERTLREIETFMLLTSLPEAGDTWKPHHADLIQDAVFELDRGVLTDSYPPIVYATAREWASHRRSRTFGVAQHELEPSTRSESSTYVYTCLSTIVFLKLPSNIIEGFCGVSLTHINSLEQGLPSGANSAQDALFGNDLARPMHTRQRSSTSADVGCTKSVAGGRGGLGTRGRAVSMSDKI